jgi:hypothetical protein
VLHQLQAACKKRSTEPDAKPVNPKKMMVFDSEALQELKDMPSLREYK